MSIFARENKLWYMKKNNNTPSLSREGRGGSRNGAHKKSWQETYATPEEIKAMLDSRVSLRYNEVRGRPEIHWLSAGPTIRADEQGLLTIFGGDGGVTDGYANLTDRDVNTLWMELCQEKPVIKQHLQNVIESDYVPTYHPFLSELETMGMQQHMKVLPPHIVQFIVDKFCIDVGE